MKFKCFNWIPLGTVCFPFSLAINPAEESDLTQHHDMKGRTLRACLSMMTVLVHPGRLLKLTMPAAAAEEDIQTLKMKRITQRDERILIPQGLACSWSCMPEGCATRMTKKLPKRMEGAASRTF